MKYYSKGICLTLFAVIAIFLISACYNHDSKIRKTQGKYVPLSKKESIIDEKDYDLTIEKSDEKRAKQECLSVMNLIQTIYEQENMDNFYNINLSQKTEDKIFHKLKQVGEPVTCKGFCHNMLHYKKMEQFITQVEKGKNTEIVIYELHSDGGIGRSEFTFDGKNMYSLYVNSIWSEKNKPIIVGASYKKIKNWDYSKKGWFRYELSVPEIPEVSEIVNGTVMIRVKPIKENYRKITKRYLMPISYQGNNLLTANWDKKNMDVLDYNGLFEFLYCLKYKEKFKAERYENGIPKQDFEQLILEYLPITKEQICTYGAYDKKKGVYKWQSLGCGNYVLNEFGSTFPEIVEVENNKDGTSTLTVDAVCDSEGREQLFQHKVKVRFLEKGGIRFISNKIVKNNADWLFNYKFRVTEP